MDTPQPPTLEPLFLDNDHTRALRARKAAWANAPLEFFEALTLADLEEGELFIFLPDPCDNEFTQQHLSDAQGLFEKVRGNELRYPKGQEHLNRDYAYSRTDDTITTFPSSALVIRIETR